MNELSEKVFAEYEAMINEQRIQNYDYNRIKSAPHVVLNAKVSKDGNLYCCLLGDNLQEGIAGFGETPQKACAKFDKIWMNGE